MAHVSRSPSLSNLRCISTFNLKFKELRLSIKYFANCIQANLKMTTDNFTALHLPIDAETQQTIINMVNEISEEIRKNVSPMFLEKLMKISERTETTSHNMDLSSKALADTLSSMIASQTPASDIAQSPESNFKPEQYLEKFIALLKSPEGDVMMTLISAGLSLAIQKNIERRQI